MLTKTIRSRSGQRIHVLRAVSIRRKKNHESGILAVPAPGDVTKEMIDKEMQAFIQCARF